MKTYQITEAYLREIEMVLEIFNSYDPEEKDRTKITELEDRIFQIRSEHERAR